MADNQPIISPSEEWKPVVGFPHYEVSSHGKVRSLDRNVAARDGSIKNLRGVQLKPGMDSNGRPLVVLRKDGKSFSRRVHTLVIEAHVGPRPPGHECCHINDDRLDNRADNLYWGTRSDNLHDSVRNKRHHQSRKTHCLRGHQFVPENIVPSKAKQGRRNCLACQRATSRVKYHSEMRPMIQEIADSYYRQIIGK